MSRMRKTTTRETVHLGDIPTSAAAVAVLAAANTQIRTEPEPLEELGERVTAPVHEELLEQPKPAEAHSSGFERAWMDAREAAREQEARDREALNETLYRGHGADDVEIVGLAPPVPVKGE